MMTKSFAILCLVLLLPCAWTLSLNNKPWTKPIADIQDQLNEQSDDSYNPAVQSMDEMSHFFMKVVFWVKNVITQLAGGDHEAFSRVIHDVRDFSHGKTLHWTTGNLHLHLKALYRNKHLNGASIFFTPIINNSEQPLSD